MCGLLLQGRVGRWTPALPAQAGKLLTLLPDNLFSMKDRHGWFPGHGQKLQASQKPGGGGLERGTDCCLLLDWTSMPLGT